MFCARVSTTEADTPMNGTINGNSRTLDPMDVDLDMLLADKISQRYLQRFAERFFCADTVSCVIALRDLQLRLKAAETTDDDAVHDATRDFVGTFFSSKAKQPIADVPSALRERLSHAVLVSKIPTDEGPSTADLLSQADATVSKFIAQDIVKRFRDSAECKELLLVHPRHALTNPAIRQLFHVGLSRTQRDTLAFWLEAHNTQHQQDAILQRAVKVFESVDAVVMNDVVQYYKVKDSLHALLHTMAAGSTGSPLVAVQAAAVSTLSQAYLEFLDGPHGTSMRVLAGVKTALPPITTSVAAAHLDSAHMITLSEGSNDDDDYAAGW